MRALGLLIAFGLIATALLLRRSLADDAAAILAAEAAVRTKIVALHEDAMRVLARGAPHPGLAPLAAQRPELGIATLDPSRWDPPLDFEVGRDDVYVYGLTDTTERDPQSGTRVHGYVLRAWPRRYGETGDLEFQITDDGRLFVGQNRVGRSGFARGFPPPFPATELGTPRGEATWWREAYR